MTATATLSQDTAYPTALADSRLLSLSLSLCSLVYDEQISACNWAYSRADCTDRPDADLEQLLREADRTQFPEGLLNGYPDVRDFLGL